MTGSKEIVELVNSTPFVDTHEHTWEESSRLDPGNKLNVPRDFSLLLYHYSDSDLQVAGLPDEDRKRLFDPAVDISEKWRIVAPYYERTRNTGYLMAVREAIRQLYGENDLTADTCVSISEKLSAGMKPGYYRHILRNVAKVEHSQVNSFEGVVFNETQYPDLLCQDLSFVGLSTGLDVDRYANALGLEIGALSDWHALIDQVFATCGPRAIAVKNQSAYGRRLDYDDVKAEDVAPVFERRLKDKSSLSADEEKAVQDHLFHYCIVKATEYNLPVKLHTGYYAGHNHMPLERLRQNASDMCPLLKAYPQTKFVLMHITYPYQDEAIALAKHYPNAYIDMCWAWIINPAACVRFVKEFLMAAPVSKILTFGGDYGPVELVPGHASVARKGLTQAFSELHAERWLEPADVQPLIDRVMRGNAHEIFDYAGTLANWKKAAPAAVS